MHPDIIEQLSWPKNARTIGRMSIEEIQRWYAAQPMQQMIWLGQNKEFKRFLFWHYTLPVKLLRFYYMIRRNCFSNWA